MVWRGFIEHAAIPIRRVRAHRALSREWVLREPIVLARIRAALGERGVCGQARHTNAHDRTLRRVLGVRQSACPLATPDHGSAQ